MLVKGFPIYISLTSIFKNQNILYETLKSIVVQSKLPDKIFLYLSEEPYMLDKGFKNRIITDKNLLLFLDNHESLISINWVKNHGPYLKLLPLLKQKWDEDCVIITIDDDTIYHKDLVKNLVEDYSKHMCIIGYRGFTPKFNELKDFDYNIRSNTIQKSLYNFATGKGGILYNPIFFHKTKELIFDEGIYMNKCTTNDDVWFYLLRIKNGIDCFIDDKPWLINDLTSERCLFHCFNAHNNNNTILFRNIFEILQLKDTV